MKYTLNKHLWYYLFDNLKIYNFPLPSHSVVKTEKESNCFTYFVILISIAEFLKLVRKGCKYYFNQINSSIVETLCYVTRIQR